ncbi:MAG: InlB B-repeat-containing protein [Rhodoluna sp.]
MKNFSLKALGAFIFATGLVVAGVAAPASATAVAAWTTSQPTFVAGSTPAMDITFTPTNSASTDTFRQVAVTIKDAQGQSMSLASITSGSLAGCKLSAIGGSHVQIQSNTCTRVNGMSSYNLISLENAGGGGSGSAYGAFNISLLSGVATGLMAGQTYTVWVATMNDSTVVESATLSVTIPAPTSVTLNRNGGTGNASQPTVSGGNVTLPANPFTRTGFDFTGWRKDSANAGTVYQPGDVVAVSGTVNFYAQWSPAGSGGSSASANLTLNASTGQLIAGSTVGVSASGLQSTAAYTVTVQSTPQTIGTGNAVSGAVSTNVTLPSGLEAGWHTLTFTSTASDGSAVESKYYFKVSASGTLLATSTTIPAELANTGVDSTSAALLLAGGLSLALVGAEMFMIARRKRSN